MKAAVLTGIRKVEVRDAPDTPAPGTGEVLVSVGAVGVCGSDVHYFRTGRIGGQVVEYPYTVGHECSGVVEQVGPHVSRVRPGDRIAIEPAIACHSCDQCIAGRPNTCRNLRFMSCPGEAEGLLRERILVPEKNCFTVPDNVTLEQAAFAEPLSVGVYSVKRSSCAAGSSAGVLGTGPIGLSVLLSLRAAGITACYASDRLAPRRAAAGRVGAKWIGDPGATDVLSALVAGPGAPEPAGLDVVFECCGEQEALDQAIRLLKPGGELVIVGIPDAGRISFDVDDFRRKEISTTYIRRQAKCVAEAVDVIAANPADVDSLITHRFPVHETQDAFELVDGYRDGVIKAMIVLPRMQA
ncbi:MAG: alcohol dehydrogenase catalytic domain-containing protein [Chitinivibrionales bacterium]|nr:alcohol dehydrogenase catalytic domain-containing protein [Chitinivibrionales bacterium]MBD3394052.1 alcohol dehydrogenase catalytic domain-containing protein [Chitinivibrionales bacterium]